ncbi:hypothetical protein [Gemmata sp.]|uniref:hypothetical protein n=1 Tax=Gemmata sp. TaxID=1914242 RepID=UPI003F704142
MTFNEEAPMSDGVVLVLVASIGIAVALRADAIASYSAAKYQLHPPWVPRMWGDRMSRNAVAVNAMMWRVFGTAVALLCFAKVGGVL